MPLTKILVVNRKIKNVIKKREKGYFIWKEITQTISDVSKKAQPEYPEKPESL